MPATLAVAPDWRTSIPEEKCAPIRAWLWSIAAMTLAVLIVGGITRLTQSGLSIVDWKPLMGVVPPLNEAQWIERFEQYRQYPEYQLLRRGMSLDEFKFIFFWEYFHRLLARGIGVVFLVPFVAFWVRGWFTRPLLHRALVLFALGGAQGVMGWLMVQSGLVDRPSVSHFRLAAHLSLAFLIFGYAVWLARELVATRVVLAANERRLMLRLLMAVGGVLALQVVWGAFVAGLRAGKYYPTFPLMGGRLVAPELALATLSHDVFVHPTVVQWLHRVLGTVLLLLSVALLVQVRRHVSDVVSRWYATGFTTLVVVQYALGVLTLLFLVPVSLGVIHQGTAMILFGVWLCWLHRVVRAGAAAQES